MIVVKIIRETNPDRLQEKIDTVIKNARIDPSLFKSASTSSDPNGFISTIVWDDGKVQAP